jgi:hypothetical protein
MILCYLNPLRAPAPKPRRLRAKPRLIQAIQRRDRLSPRQNAILPNFLRKKPAMIAGFQYPQGESNPCPLAENQIS